MTVIPPEKHGTLSFPQPSLQAPSPFERPVNQYKPQEKGFDLWGAVQRRKYLIILLASVGGLIGYMQYTNTPKTYASSTKLMVSTQAPPELIDGNVRVVKDSNQKYANLIKSDLVLGNAVEAGNFLQMRSFAGVGNPVGSLKGGMLRVITDPSEAIVLRVEGPIAEELPAILGQIVGSFTDIIKEDSRDVSEQTVELIEKLAGQLSQQKDGADVEKQEILGRLGTNVFDESGRAINPYEQQYGELKAAESGIQKSIWEIGSRIDAVNKALAKDPQTEKLDPIQTRVLALEARDYLNLNDSSVEAANKLGGPDPAEEERNELVRIARELETRIEELRFQIDERSGKFGPGHSSIINLNRRISLYAKQLEDANIKIQEIDKQLVESANSSDAVGEMESRVQQLKAVQQQEWISMYQVALQREAEMLNVKLSNIKDQEQAVTRSMGAAAADINRLNVLQHQIDKKEQAVELIMDRLSEINVLANNYTMTKVRTLDEPSYGFKVAPSLPKLVGQGVFLAALLGVGLAVLIDMSELAFRSPNEIFDRLQLPVVGKVPRIDTRKFKPTKGSACLVTAHSPASTAAEAFRDIRTGLFFQANANDLKTILFTSPSAGDGKSTTVGNLAVSIAQAGKRVILIDADFRRPRVDQYFGEDLRPGVLDVLTGKTELADAIKESDLQEGLSILTTGGRPKNPGELVTSDVFRNMIETLRNQFDFVLIDAPPVLPVADPATIASFADGVYMVTRIRKGVKLSAQKAKESLDRVGATWMGIIVNGIDENPHYSEYGYQYGGYSYYGGAYGKYYEANNKEYREKVGS